MRRVSNLAGARAEARQSEPPKEKLMNAPWILPGLQHGRRRPVPWRDDDGCPIPREDFRIMGHEAATVGVCVPKLAATTNSALAFGLSDRRGQHRPPRRPRGASVEVKGAELAPTDTVRSTLARTQLTSVLGARSEAIVDAAGGDGDES